MTHAARWFAISASLFAFSLSTGAWGFCRATTCDPEENDCPREDHCITEGAKLFWPSSCVSFYVQADGSGRNGIDADVLGQEASNAFDRWLRADCDGERPAISVEFKGQVPCNVSEYNPHAGNANIVMIHDDEWPYAGAGHTLGLSLVRFGAESGEIWDVDIEVNGTAGLSVGDPVTAIDLASVLTHETGHFLGLDHSQFEDATMFETYDGTDPALRSLSTDDERGICAIYPPSRATDTASCSPKGGFSPECGGANVEDDGSGGGEDGETASSSDGCTIGRLGAHSPGGRILPLFASAIALLTLRRRRASLLLPLILALALSGCSEPGPDVAQNFDVVRFSGRWYEIARVPRDYDEFCHDTVADYRIVEDGKLELKHTCFLRSSTGPIHEMNAFATTDDPAVPAKLSLHVGLYTGDYWVLDVGDQYEYAVVGHPSRTMLWVLSRTPTLDEAKWDSVIELITKQGYSEEMLRKTPQSSRLR